MTISNTYTSVWYHCDSTLILTRRDLDAKLSTRYFSSKQDLFVRWSERESKIESDGEREVAVLEVAKCESREQGTED